MKRDFTDQKFSSKGALWPFLKQIFSYSFRYKRWFVPFLLAAMAVAIIDAVFPLVWLKYIDTVITPLVERYKEMSSRGMEPALEWDGLLRFGGIYLVLNILQVLGVGTFIYFAGKIQEYLIFDLRQDMFNRLQRLSFSFYDRSAIGWLISRITSDTDRVSEVISWGALSLVWGSMMVLACFGAMLLYSWKLTLVVLATLPVLFVLSLKLRLRILQYSRESRRVNSEMTAYFNEHVHGIEVNKMTSQESTAARGFGRMSSRMQRASFRASLYSAMYYPVVIMVGSVAAALVIYLGGHLVLLKSGITLGVLAAFFGYATTIFEPIVDITRFYATAQSAISAGERIFSLIQEPVEIVDPPGAADFHSLQGKIGFENVCFHYVKERPILENFNLVIQPGESVALVGPTGEGKTTIASLIARFYQPVQGKILIDGIDYRTRTLPSYRRQLGIILQTPHLFAGTILENIRYGNREASEERVWEVLRSIGAVELQVRLPEEVGEGGGSLSTGEKQLISFARVLLTDPRILIMDEATSSVDTLAEARIQQGIAALISDRTSIIIAHRLSTIKHCDRILVIRQGRILEEGSHRALLRRRGFYHRLYTRQSRERVA